MIIPVVVQKWELYSSHELIIIQKLIVYSAALLSSPGLISGLTQSPKKIHGASPWRWLDPIRPCPHP